MIRLVTLKSKYGLHKRRALKLLGRVVWQSRDHADTCRCRKCNEAFDAFADRIAHERNRHDR